MAYLRLNGRAVLRTLNAPVHYSTCSLLYPSADCSDLAMTLALGSLFLFLGLSALEIREAGIFFAGQLLKWERIEFYEWEEKALTIRVKR